MKNCTARLLIVGLTLVNAGELEAALRFHMTILQAPPEYEFTVASSISDDGRIAGTGTGFGGIALYWATSDSPPVAITGQGAGCSQAYGVNSNGTVVGLAMEGFFAYRWQPGSDLETLPGTTICCPRAEAINDSGAVVGRMPFDLSQSSDFAALWIGETVQNLGAALSHANSIALDISPNGNIVGRSENNAARWVNGQAHLLTGLENNFSFAHGVNNHWEIVGEKAASGPIAFIRPYVWRNHVLTELPLLGGNFGVAESINEHGFIVGMSSTAQIFSRAVLWRDDQVIDLNERVVNMPPNTLLTAANDINNQNEIVGFALVNMQTFFLEQAFVLQPIAPADIVIDGNVNVDDLLALIENWGACPASSGVCHADVIEDGVVNVDDLLAVIHAWGKAK